MNNAIKSVRGAVVVTASITLSLTACGGSKSASAAHSSAADTKNSSATSSAGSAASSALIDDNGLKALAAKVGCSSSDINKISTKSKISSASSAIQCDVGSMGYFVVRTKTATSGGDFMKAMASGAGLSGDIPYVKGSNWVVVGMGEGQNDKPTREEAQDVQKKVGGTVEVESAH